MKLEEQYVLENCGDMSEIKEACELIKEYRQTDFYESKNKLISEWEIDHENIYLMVISIFTATLTKEYLSMQALVGMLNHKIKLTSEKDRVKILSDIIGLVAQTGLIYIHSLHGEYHQVCTEYEFEEGIPLEKPHQIIRTKPKRIVSNWDEEFRTGSLINGNKLNHHEGDIRLSHFNKMNRIPLKLNKRFINKYEELPKKELDTLEKEEAWDLFVKESSKRYDELNENDVFYTTYKVDFRGRSYSTQYYLSPQGSSYKKAIVQLSQTEIVTGD